MTISGVRGAGETQPCAITDSVPWNTQFLADKTKPVAQADWTQETELTQWRGSSAGCLVNG